MLLLVLREGTNGECKLMCGGIQAEKQKCPGRPCQGCSSSRANGSIMDSRWTFMFRSRGSRALRSGTSRHQPTSTNRVVESSDHLLFTGRCWGTELDSWAVATKCHTPNNSKQHRLVILHLREEEVRQYSCRVKSQGLGWIAFLIPEENPFPCLFYLLEVYHPHILACVLFKPSQIALISWPQCLGSVRSLMPLPSSVSHRTLTNHTGIYLLVAPG